MADSTVWDLTAETEMTAAHRLYVHETDTNTRALHATYSLFGGLELDTASDPTTGNVTAAAGKLYHLDISGMTANRKFILPDTAAVGERVGLFVEVAAPAPSANYELLAATAAAGSLMNGVDISAGSTTYCYFITNESAVFRCIKAGGAGDTDWVLEHDGRIPATGELNELLADTPAEQNINTSNTWYQMTFTTGADNGPCADNTNNRITVRRDGTYSFTAGVLFDDLDDGELGLIAIAEDDGGVELELCRCAIDTSSAAVELTITTCGQAALTVATSKNIFGRVLHQESGNTPVIPATGQRFVAMMEIL